MNPEKDLNDLVRRLKEAGGANLRGIVLYGSAAGGEFDREHSDLNILCLLDRLNAASLRALRPVTLWWWRRGHPAPLLFTFGELRDSADVFCIELLDMKQQHRVLWGDDPLAQLEVPMDLHRLQVERELRTNVIRLRQAYLRSRGRDSELVELMIASVSSFAALFRHSLIALGEAPPDARLAVADRLASRLGLDSAAFLAVLDLRERKRRVREIDVDRTFAEYLNAVMRVAEEMDRCLAAK
jgi:predicted nucleotidyltransferase